MNRPRSIWLIALIALAAAILGCGSEPPPFFLTAAYGGSTAIPEQATSDASDTPPTQRATLTEPPASPDTPAPTAEIAASTPRPTVIIPTLIPCPLALPPRMQIGARGRVSFNGMGDLFIRNVPGRNSRVEDRLEEGTVFTVEEGPICEDGWWWWFVDADGQALGWVSEGDDFYFIEPYP